jgi:uncharacterized membrane protein YGL010W
MICVLPILLTSILLVRSCSPTNPPAHHHPTNGSVQFTNTPTLLSPSSYSKNPILNTLPPNAGLLICLAYCTLYVLLEPVAGTLLALLLLASTAYANHLTSNYNPIASYYAISINIVSWIAQFIGHGVFEGRAPALFDNLYQAVFLAPLFVWLEFLFMLGYRSDLKKKLDRWAEEDIKKFQDAKKANGDASGHTKSET